MKLQGRNLIQPEDFSINEIDEILSLSQNIIDNPSKYSRVCEGNLLATLFYEEWELLKFYDDASAYPLGQRWIWYSWNSGQ